MIVMTSTFVVLLSCHCLWCYDHVCSIVCEVIIMSVLLFIPNCFNSSLYTCLWCYYHVMQRHGRYNEQLRVDVGTRRGRGDKVVMVSLLTCPSLTSCLLSCKSMTRAGCRGNEKVPILGELKKNCHFVLADGTRSAFSTFLIIVPDFRQSARVFLPVPPTILPKIGHQCRHVYLAGKSK